MRICAVLVVGLKPASDVNFSTIRTRIRSDYDIMNLCGSVGYCSGTSLLTEVKVRVLSWAPNFQRRPHSFRRAIRTLIRTRHKEEKL